VCDVEVPRNVYLSRSAITFIDGRLVLVDSGNESRKVPLPVFSNLSQVLQIVLFPKEKQNKQKKMGQL
jgi:hypothetical protein